MISKSWLCSELKRGVENYSPFDRLRANGCRRFSFLITLPDFRTCRAQQSRNRLALCQAAGVLELESETIRPELASPEPAEGSKDERIGNSPRSWIVGGLVVEVPIAGLEIQNLPRRAGDKPPRYTEQSHQEGSEERRLGSRPSFPRKRGSIFLTASGSSRATWEESDPCFGHEVETSPRPKRARTRVQISTKSGGQAPTLQRASKRTNPSPPIITSSAAAVF